MNTNKLFIFLPILLIILSACGAKATPEYVPEGADRDVIVAVTDVIIQDVVTGIENMDYETFSKHFSQVMINSIKPADAETIFTQFGALGKSESIELKNVQVVGEYYAVRYTVTYGNKEVVVRVVVDKSNTNIMNCLWFE